MSKEEKPKKKSKAGGKRKGAGVKRGTGTQNNLKFSDDDVHDIGDELIEWMLQDGNIYPMRFFLFNKKYTKRDYETLRHRSLFDEYRETAQEIKKTKLLEGGLDRSYDGNFARFVLATQHGMNEKTISEVEHKGNSFNITYTVPEKPKE